MKPSFYCTQQHQQNSDCVVCGWCAFACWLGAGSHCVDPTLTPLCRLHICLCAHVCLVLWGTSGWLHAVWVSPDQPCSAAVKQQSQLGRTCCCRWLLLGRTRGGTCSRAASCQAVLGTFVTGQVGMLAERWGYSEEKGPNCCLYVRLVCVPSSTQLLGAGCNPGHDMLCVGCPLCQLYVPSTGRTFHISLAVSRSSPRPRLPGWC